MDSCFFISNLSLAWGSNEKPYKAFLKRRRNEKKNKPNSAEKKGKWNQMENISSTISIFLRFIMTAAHPPHRILHAPGKLNIRGSQNTALTSLIQYEARKMCGKSSRKFMKQFSLWGGLNWDMNQFGKVGFRGIPDDEVVRKSR